MINESNDERRYDFIVGGAGAAGSVLAAELSASGAQVLIIESGGPDDAPTISNPSIWFFNVGGPLDYHLPVKPSPRLNNRKFNMALGHVLGGGTSINALLRLSKPPTGYPVSTHVYAQASHLIYGLTAEVVRRSLRKAL